MRDPEFVRQMQEALKQQLGRGETATKARLHDAEVRRIDCPKKWRVLKNLVKESVNAINSGSSNISYSEGAGDTMIVKNQVSTRSVEATFSHANGNISYQAPTACGSFVPHVVGDELEHCWQNTIPSREVALSVEKVGDPVTIEKMTEILIRCAVASEC